MTPIRQEWTKETRYIEIENQGAGKYSPLLKYIQLTATISQVQADMNVNHMTWSPNECTTHKWWQVTHQSSSIVVNNTDFCCFGFVCFVVVFFTCNTQSNPALTEPVIKGTCEPWHYFRHRVPSSKNRYTLQSVYTLFFSFFKTQFYY